jgi:hypothetical protein
MPIKMDTSEAISARFQSFNHQNTSKQKIEERIGHRQTQVDSELFLRSPHANAVFWMILVRQQLVFLLGVVQQLQYSTV